MAQQDQEVLDDRDQVILDALPLEPAPAGALEAVLRGGPSEAAFQQPLSPASIPARGRAVGLSARQVEQFLVGIAFERATTLVLGAMGAKLTGGTRARRRAVFGVTAPGVKVVPPQDLSGGANKEVLFGVVIEALRGVDVCGAMIPLPAA